MKRRAGDDKGWVLLIFDQAIQRDIYDEEFDIGSLDRTSSIFKSQFGSEYSRCWASFILFTARLSEGSLQ